MIHPSSQSERDGLRKQLAAGQVLSEMDSLRLLAVWDIPVVRHEQASTEAKALSIASQIGYPIVLKTASEGILHKSDVGGVHLDIKDDVAARAAYRTLARSFGGKVVVAKMMRPGIELALGMTRDPQFGPVMMVGAGGILVELLGDFASALVPFGPATARRLLDRLKLRKLLDGVRGQCPVDVHALAVIVSRFSVLCDELGDVVDGIDVNPLICGAEIAAADALVVTKGARPWI